MRGDPWIPCGRLFSSRLDMGSGQSNAPLPSCSNCTDHQGNHIVEYLPGAERIKNCCIQDDIVIDIPVYNAPATYGDRSGAGSQRPPQYGDYQQRDHQQIQQRSQPSDPRSHKAPQQQSMNQAPQQQPQQWTCGSCTLLNPAHASSCVACGARRAEEVSPSLDHIKQMEQNLSSQGPSTTPPGSTQQGKTNKGMGQIAEGDARAQDVTGGALPSSFEVRKNLNTQCCCFPHVDNKPEETTMLEHRFWCCYCCCSGLGFHCDLDPLMQRLSCACCHCSWESADCYNAELKEGLCSEVINCCCVASCIAHFPLPRGTPQCVCFNEKCCYKGGRMAAMQPKAQPDGFGSEGRGRQRRTSITSVEEFEETSHILKNQNVPCFCCCCGCTEDYGKNLCGHNTKCCCTRCDARWGLPCLPGCKVLSLCCGAYYQCRCPVMAEAPCCVCCGVKCEGCNLTKCLATVCPRRAPQWCEKTKCFSCGDLCPCFRRCRCCRC